LADGALHDQNRGGHQKRDENGRKNVVDERVQLRGDEAKTTADQRTAIPADCNKAGPVRERAPQRQRAGGAERIGEGQEGADGDHRYGAAPL